MDPWLAVSGMGGVVVSAGLVWLRETLSHRRENAVRSEERARLEGEIVATLKIHGSKLDSIQTRVDSLPCIGCKLPAIAPATEAAHG